MLLNQQLEKKKHHLPSETQKKRKMGMWNGRDYLLELSAKWRRVRPCVKRGS